MIGGRLARAGHLPLLPEREVGGVERGAEAQDLVVLRGRDVLGDPVLVDRHEIRRRQRRRSRPRGLAIAAVDQLDRDVPGRGEGHRRSGADLALIEALVAGHEHEPQRRRIVRPRQRGDRGLDRLARELAAAVGEQRVELLGHPVEVRGERQHLPDEVALGRDGVVAVLEQRELDADAADLAVDDAGQLAEVVDQLPQGRARLVDQAVHAARGVEHERDLHDVDLGVARGRGRDRGRSDHRGWRARRGAAGGEGDADGAPEGGDQGQAVAAQPPLIRANGLGHDDAPGKGGAPGRTPRK